MGLYDSIINMIGISDLSVIQKDYVCLTCCVLVVLACWAIIKMVGWLFSI